MVAKRPELLDDLGSPQAGVLMKGRAEASVAVPGRRAAVEGFGSPAGP